MEFFTKEDIKQIKEGLTNGEITLTSLGKQKVEALSIEPYILAEILRKNPNNYILFLWEDKCPYSKSIILEDIIKAQNCSSDLI